MKKSSVEIFVRGRETLVCGIMFSNGLQDFRTISFICAIRAPLGATSGATQRCYLTPKTPVDFQAVKCLGVRGVTSFSVCLYMSRHHNQRTLSSVGLPLRAFAMSCSASR